MRSALAIAGGDRHNTAVCTVEVHGSCFAGHSVIQQLVERRDWSGLVTLRGSYSLAVRHDDTVTLAASSVGAANLFYLQQGPALLYSTSVFDLVRRAGVSWRWNWRALADVMSLEHCVDGETLHSDVKKLMPGSVVHWDGATLTLWKMPWSDRIVTADASPRGAVDALMQSCRLYAEGDVVLSMSAGFDSRLLLACLLAAGIKPRLVTMGARGSTDVYLSEGIARRFGLRIDVVPLQPEDYFDSARTIIRLTSGAKTFQHWHTYAYAKNAPLTRDSRLFIGSNGEAARSYYLDKGIAALIANQLPARAVSRVFWSRKLRPTFNESDIHSLHPQLTEQLTPEGIKARRERIMSFTPGRLLDGLDHFYTEQHVPGFIGNGLALVNEHATPAVPMLDREWMAQIWNLPRDLKLDSKWHRYAIGVLCPDLLSFDEEKTGLPMGSGPRPLYWLPKSRLYHVPYVNYPLLFRSEAILQLVAQSTHLIEPVAQSALVRSIFERHQRGEDLSPAASFLLTLLYFSRSLREAGIEAVS